MKKTFLLLIIALALLTSCASTSKVFNIDEYGPVSIIEMYTNSQVSIYEDYDDVSGFITKYIEKIKDEEKPLSTMRLGKLAEAKFLDAIEGSKTFLSKEETTNVRAYVKQEKSGIKNHNQARVIEGYKLFNENDTQKVAYILKELNAKAAMWIDFEFNKILPDQIERDIRWGDVQALVTMKVQIKDVKGKVLYKKEHQAVSSARTKASSSSMKYEEQLELAELFPDIIDEVILSFLEDVNLSTGRIQTDNMDLPKINVIEEIAESIEGENQESAEISESLSDTSPAN